MDTKTRPTACAEGGEDGFGGVGETVLAGFAVPSFGEEAGKISCQGAFRELYGGQKVLMALKWSRVAEFGM